MKAELILCLALTVATPLAAVDPRDTLLLQQPDLSPTQVAFVYDSSVWVADRDGGPARRLTTAGGEETRPVFSPDGQWIAFSGNYDGNQDVYLIPAAGGVPRRLTWHPGPDTVRDFLPDGSGVLFQSSRSVHTRRHRHLYTVSIAGGMPRRLPIPTGFKAAPSPDGRRIAYSPLAERFGQWKHYRGGTASRIWILDMDTEEVVEVPQPAGRCNDTDPLWIGGTLYFNSDRAGELNLFRFDEAQGEVEQLTFFDDFPVLEARAGDGVIVFEQAARLHWLDPLSGHRETFHLAVGADLREARPRWASDDKWVRDASPSPAGRRVALEYRGEIVTLPAENGDARNLTRSTGENDRSPAWSPDGSLIAYFSDQGGEYGLHLQTQDGSGEARRIEIDGAGFYFDPVWSPDSRHLAFRDNSLTLFVVDVASGQQTKVASESVYSPVVTMTYEFSPDSRWLAYTLNDAGLTQTAYLYSLEEGSSRRVSDGLAEISSPTFDAGGDYLYLLGSTDAGPVKDWFAQSNTDMLVHQQVYVVTLDAAADNPLPPESDEVATDDAEDSDEGKEGEKDVRVEVDFEGLSSRIQPLVTDTQTLRNLRAGKAGTLFYLETVGRTSFASYDGGAKLQTFSLESREVKTLTDGVDSFELTPDREHLLYSKGDDLFLVEAGGEFAAGDGRLPLGKVRVKIDPRAEWAQIFDEAWRINRDYFYADNYHGVDWQAVQEKYAPWVEHVANRADLERLMRWMASELVVGHSYSAPGDTIEENEEVSVGLLGADYEVAGGHYRFAKIYGGLNWTPDLRSPLVGAGIDVSEGEVLLAVDGRELFAEDNLFELFENTVGRQVHLRVASSSDGRGARTVTVVPIASEASLRLRDWVEGNLRRVHEATDGRVAYVYVPDTADRGHAYFKRYFYPQSHLEAIIVDERYNGGGLVADTYIDTLRRPFTAYWAMRYGEDLPTPRGAIFGPKVMITDETAGSGGDLLPWMFRKYELGTLVGKRTWGGLVGILGYPTLLDGGRMTAPNLAIWTEEGWVVENEGVPPDVEVEQWPREVNAGHDPQLERAIEIVMEQLEKEPRRVPERPPFPIRAH